MKINKLIEKINREKKRAEDEYKNAEGLVRLQEVMKDYEGEDKLIWSEVLLEEIKNNPRTQGHHTGIEKLDEISTGFREQQLITLSGHSKHGKTAMSLHLIDCLPSLNPIMIPLEQSNEELIQQRLENDHTIPNFLSPRRLASQVTTDWIEERIIEGIAKYNTKMAVIDHLSYIDDSQYSKENHAYRIEMTMKALKNIAKRWNITVLLLVHINQHEEGKAPTLQDLKGSSAILQESDIVLMVWRKNEMVNQVRVYDNKTMLSVLANRWNGKIGSVGLIFDETTGGFKQEHHWVEKMVSEAENRVKADDDFNDL